MCIKTDAIYANCTHLADSGIRWVSLCQEAKLDDRQPCSEFEVKQDVIKGSCPSCLSLPLSQQNDSEGFKTPELQAYEAATRYRDLHWQTINPQELKLATGNSQVNLRVDFEADSRAEHRAKIVAAVSDLEDIADFGELHLPVVVDVEEDTDDEELAELVREAEADFARYIEAHTAGSEHLEDSPAGSLSG